MELVIAPAGGGAGLGAAIVTPAAGPPGEGGVGGEGGGPGGGVGAKGRLLGLMSSEEVSRMMALGDEEAARLQEAGRQAQERDAAERGHDRARAPGAHEQQYAAEPAQACGAGRSCGLGPNGAWEHVQVVTPEMANKLVLNRGAVFTKYSYKKGAVNMRSKAERLVWLSGDNRIMWKAYDPAGAATASPSSSSSSFAGWGSRASGAPAAKAEGSTSASSGAAGMAVADVVSISKTAPGHYGGEPARSLYIVSKKRSLMLEVRAQLRRPQLQHTAHARCALACPRHARWVLLHLAPAPPEALAPAPLRLCRGRQTGREGALRSNPAIRNLTPSTSNLTPHPLNLKRAASLASDQTKLPYTTLHQTKSN